MKNFYFLAIFFISVIVNAQFTKIMDLTGTLTQDMFAPINNYNVWNNKIFYHKPAADNTIYIMVTDGTVAGTQVVKNIPFPAGSTSMIVNSYKPAGNGIYIKINYMANNNLFDEVWFSDGTAANTVKVSTNSRAHIGGLSHTATINNFNRPHQPSHLGNIFYFWRSADGNGANTTMYLWKSDGTASGTMQAATAVHYPFDNQMSDEYFDMGLIYNGDYYFLGQDVSSNLVKNKLYKLNGGNPSIIASFSEITRMGTVFKGNMYFLAKKDFGTNSGYTQREVFKSDGTTAGTGVFVNLNGSNDGQSYLDSFSFHKTTDYMFIGSANNNVFATDGYTSALIPLYTGTTYSADGFYYDDKNVFFIRKSSDTNLYDSFSYSLPDFTKKIITKRFYNSTVGQVLNGTLWIANKPSYSSYYYTPWRSAGSDDTTLATTNSYNFATNFVLLNSVLHGFSSYFGMNTSLWRFDPNFTFTNTYGDNNWGNPNNWTAKNTPLNYDDVTIPASQTPQITGNAFANNLTVSSPINLTSGNLNVGGNLNLGSSVTLNNNNLNLIGSNSQISNGNATNYIVTNGTGTVNVENLNTAKGTVNLPIGTATNYNPVSISNSGTSDTFSVKVSDGISNTSNGAVNATWDIAETTAGGSDVSLTLGWNASQQNATFNSGNAKVGHFVNGAWTEENSGMVSGSGPYSISATGISSFSPFAVMNFTALGTVDFTKSEISVYPNPFTEILNAEVKENATLSIFDLSGKLVSIHLLKKGRNEINKAELQSGVYVYQIKNIKREVVSSGKIIKK